ncbi:hypothetical protein [Sphingomonas sp.]|uniref:hypothetical protein n=1 Tax=Sphingomonas sp. TaxID=28214 RepID=UPI003BACC1C5
MFVTVVMNDATASSSFPDGIAAAHADPATGYGRGRRRWLALILLSVLMIAALAGVFGGGKTRAIVVSGPAAQLELRTPRVIRNGEFFESRIRVTARAPIAKAVIAVDATLWRDMTINTMIPAPAEESFKDGAFRFDYGPLKPGETLIIKIDGQINPPLFAGTEGTVAVLDGERELAALPLDITVLP